VVIGRRNLTKGQRAMLVARMYPEPERGRGKRDQARKETETVSFTRVLVQLPAASVSSRHIVVAAQPCTRTRGRAPLWLTSIP
jgi:hypothetical protein